MTAAKFREGMVVLTLAQSKLRDRSTASSSA